MSMPEQVRKQTAAVQELYAQLNGGTPTDTPKGEGDVAPPTAKPADEVPPANNAPQPPEGHRAGGKDDEETLRQKYRTLQGMYNAEVPRLHAQNRELSQKVQRLEELLAGLSTQQPSAPSAQTTAQQRLITEQEVEEYGDSLEVMRKVSREEVAALNAKIAQLESLLTNVQNVVPTVEQVAKRQAVSAEQQFWGQLAAAVPDWREVNDDPDFQTWLLNVDPLTGISRQMILEDAQRSYDVGRVINFFNVWKGSNGTGGSVQTPNRDASQNELERQVAPGRGRSSGAAPTSDAKTYGPEDIRKFYEDVRKGVYKGREAERDRIERDIFRAQREGRLT